MTAARTWTLHRHAEQVAVCALPPNAEVPAWAAEPAPLQAVVRTAAELSLVCAAGGVPADVPALGPYVCFEVAGPLDPALVGVLAELLAPLADEEISVLTLSTYGTDWVLVPAAQADAAGTAWRRRRQVVLDPVPA